MFIVIGIVKISHERLVILIHENHNLTSCLFMCTLYDVAESHRDIAGGSLHAESLFPFATQIFKNILNSSRVVISVGIKVDPEHGIGDPFPIGGVDIKTPEERSFAFKEIAESG